MAWRIEVLHEHAREPWWGTVVSNEERYAREAWAEYKYQSWGRYRLVDGSGNVVATRRLPKPASSQFLALSYLKSLPGHEARLRDSRKVYTVGTGAALVGRGWVRAQYREADENGNGAGYTHTLTKDGLYVLKLAEEATP